jgi:transposase
MIPVEERAMIRHAYYIEHKTIRQIARERNVARQTVRKALESAAAPDTRSRPRSAPTLRPYQARLDELLTANEHLPLFLIEGFFN